MGCGDVCLLNDEGYRPIEGSSRPPLINLTVPSVWLNGKRQLNPASRLICVVPQSHMRNMLDGRTRVKQHAHIFKQLPAVFGILFEDICRSGLQLQTSPCPFDFVHPFKRDHGI